MLRISPPVLAIVLSLMAAPLVTAEKSGGRDGTISEDDLNHKDAAGAAQARPVERGLDCSGAQSRGEGSQGVQTTLPE
jgi:hypothetical protein